MKVIFDMALVGLSGQSGLARVAKELAIALNRSTECELTVCSSLPEFETWVGVYDYLEKTKILEKESLIGVNNTQYITNKEFLGKVNQFIDYLHKHNFRKTKNLKEVSLFFTNRSFRSLCSENLTGGGVYHSPYHEIPNLVHEAKSLKRILTVNDLIPVLYPQYFIKPQLKDFFKALDSIRPDTWITCISHSTKNDLCNHLKHLDSERVFVTHLAASDNFYPCQDSAEITRVKKRYKIPDSPYILSLSNLEPRKNINQVIRCFARLVQQEKLEDVSLVLAGKRAWSYDKIFAEIEQYQELKGRIIVTGFVDDADLAPLYSGAMMFVYPSLYEGFGLPPLEAMQCGVPVITSNNSSLPEVVSDAGIMVDSLDADALCQSMLDIYCDSSLRESMSEKSIARARLFSWDNCARDTIEIYKKALS
jgi:glycosyltransferase involved in cell wall biosynthesis